ncbi:MAG: TetR/AcrR family transcriptional regulator [Micrococcaceae bacterium]|nr:TetR/AcrR family transcriptional regulator [Micrococcaceae bacterium]
MEDEGFSALKVDGIVTEVGTTRPTFYRRFASVAHLALEIIKKKFGTGTPVDSGSLYQDLLTLQREEVAMFSNPILGKNFPGLLEAIRNDTSLSSLYETQFIRPRRENIARIMNAADKRNEIDVKVVDIDFICDLLLGPILARAFIPVGAPLNDNLAYQTVETVMIIIGAKAHR